jgi:hypothetical protein
MKSNSYLRGYYQGYLQKQAEVTQKDVDEARDILDANFWPGYGMHGLGYGAAGTGIGAGIGAVADGAAGAKKGAWIGGTGGLVFGLLLKALERKGLYNLIDKAEKRIS